MKKIVLMVLVVVAVVAGYVAIKYINPENNGVIYSDAYSSLAADNKAKCSYSGFVKLRKTDELHVFVSCQPELLIDETVDSKEKLMSVLNSHTVEPNLAETPQEDNVLLVVIMQIEENVVLCTSTNKGKIVNSWFDTYENYCMP